MLVATESMTQAPGRVARFSLVILFFEGFVDHLDADEGEQAEGDPVIVVGDPALHADPRQPADDRHHALKESEVKAEAEEMAAGDALQGYAGGKRDGEGVHGQGQGDTEKSSQGHGEFLRNKRTAELSSLPFALSTANRVND